MTATTTNVSDLFSPLPSTTTSLTSLLSYSTSTESSFSAPRPPSLTTPDEMNPFALGGWGRQWESDFMHKISAPVSLANFPQPPMRGEGGRESDVWQWEDDDGDEAKTIMAGSDGSDSAWSAKRSDVREPLGFGGIC